MRGDMEPGSSWSTASRSVFGDEPHLILHEHFWDEESRAATERWYIVDASSSSVAYHAQSMQGYDEQEMAELFFDAGFEDIAVLTEFPGSPEEGVFWGVVATKT